MAGDRFKFEGGNFRVDPIEGEEAAEHRAMRRAIEDNWEVLQDTAGVIRTAKMMPKIIAVCAAIFVGSAGLAAVAKLYGVGP